MTLNSLRVQKGLQDIQLQILTIGEKRIKSHRCLEGIIMVMYFTNKYLSYSERLLSTYWKTHTHTHTHTLIWDTVTTTLGITRSTFVHSPSGKFVVSWPHSFNMDKLHQYSQSLCSLSPISLTHNCVIILTVVTFPSSEASKGSLGKKRKKTFNH